MSSYINQLSKSTISYSKNRRLVKAALPARDITYYKNTSSCFGVACVVKDSLLDVDMQLQARVVLEGKITTKKK